MKVVLPAIFALLLLVGSGLAADPPATLCHDRVCFPVLDNSVEPPLALQGIGLLRYWGFRVYTAALYVPSGWEEGGDVLDANVARKLEIRYHRSIAREDIIKASEKAIAANPANDVHVLRERLNRIHSMYVDVEEGDSYVLLYEPEKGTSLYFNGEFVGLIEGADFTRAKFGIWLDPEFCLSSELRTKLLAPYSGG